MRTLRGPPTRNALLRRRIQQQPSPAQFEITQSQLDLSDVLAWIRAFHSDVAADVSLRGFASVRAGFSAWPLRSDLRCSGVISNAELASARLRVPAHLNAGAIPL